MATVLDAFYVTVGFDTSGLVKGQKEAQASFNKTKESVTKGAKDVEEASKKAASAVHTVALEVLGLFAVLTGSNSIKNFVADLVSANTALGNFADRIAVSPQTVDAWGKAAERLGGNAEATKQSFSKIAEALFQLNKNGQNLPLAFYQLQAWSKVNIDTQHGPVAFMQGLAKATQELVAQGKTADATQLLKSIGIDEGTITLLEKGGPALDGYVKSLEKLAPTPAQIAAAEKLNTSWVALNQTFTSLFNSILPGLQSALTPVLDSLGQWLSDNKEFIDAKVGEAFQAIADAIKGTNWSDVINGMSSFAKSAAEAAVSFASILSSINSALGGIQGLTDFLNRTQTTRGYSPGSIFHPNADSNPFGRSGEAGGRRAPLNPSSIPGLGEWGGAHALGGSTGPGRSYLVGERGPELFTPGGQGAVTPNGSFGGDLSIDGRNVTKSNPVPVELAGGGQGENWLQTLGKWFGGGSSGGGGGGGFLGAVGGAIKSFVGGGAGGASGGPYNPAVGAAGTYRPQYKLGARDLSDSVVNTIAGEATGKTESIDAVINNMFNRLGTKAYGPSGDLQAVARAPGQYAGYRRASPELAARIRERIKAIADGTVPDNTNGSNEYRAGWYNGPWGRKHANSPVVGGNRFAYNPAGGRGPLAPYDKPHEAFTGGARWVAAAAAGNRTSTTTNANQTHIGTIQIHTAAKDGPGVAAALQDAIKRTQYASSADPGLN